MGQDAALAERLEPDPGEEATLRPFGLAARQPVGLVVHVDRRSGILVERAIGAPGGEGAGGPTIFVVRLVAQLFRGQVEADHIPGMARQELPLLVRSDDVVRRARDQGEVAHGLGLVTQGAERTDVGHGHLGGTLAGLAGT